MERLLDRLTLKKDQVFVDDTFNHKPDRTDEKTAQTTERKPRRNQAMQSPESEILEQLRRMKRKLDILEVSACKEDAVIAAVAETKTGDKPIFLTPLKNSVTPCFAHTIEEKPT